MTTKKIFAALAAAAMIASLCACTNTTGTTSSETKESSVAAESKEESTESKADESTTDESTTDESSQADASASSTDSELGTILAIVREQVELPEDMMDFTAKRVERVFGLGEDEIVDFAGAVCTNGVSQDQIIYVKAKDEAAVEGIKEKLEANKESKYSVTKNYNPEQAPLFENAEVEVNGLYVSLVISPDAEKIRSIFSENLNN